MRSKELGRFLGKMLPSSFTRIPYDKEFPREERKVWLEKGKVESNLPAAIPVC